jgi:membrane-associated phospholipid phosphatase
MNIEIVKKPYFVASWFMLMALSYFFIDRPLAEGVHHISNAILNNIATAISLLGAGKYYILSLTVLTIVSIFVIKKKAWVERSCVFLLAVLIPGAICDLLKPILGRSRPPLFIDQHIYGFHWFTEHFQWLYWSFPSGHATTIGALMAACMLYWPRWSFGFVSVAVAVGLSRLVVEAHFLSDVMMGLWLGAIVTLYIHRYLPYFSERFFRRS